MVNKITSRAASSGRRKLPSSMMNNELHEGSLMGAKDSCKPFYEVLVNTVHEKKGSLDISLLSTHCRFDGVDANLVDHNELAYRSIQGMNHGVYLGEICVHWQSE